MVSRISNPFPTLPRRENAGKSSVAFVAYSSDFRLAWQNVRHLLQSFTNYTSTVEQSRRFHQVIPLMILILKVQYQYLNDHADSTVITKINHYWFESEFWFSKHNTSNIYTTNCEIFSKPLDKTSSISVQPDMKHFKVKTTVSIDVFSL